MGAPLSSAQPVRIADFLSPTDVLLDIDAPNKARVLKNLAKHAAAALGLKPQPIAAELLKRETLGSTGVGNGVAVPHARLNSVTKPYGVLARLARPVDYDAIDEKPVDVVFLLLLPSATEKAHLNALACVARKLREEGILDAVHKTTDRLTLYDVVTR